MICDRSTHTSMILSCRIDGLRRVLESQLWLCKEEKGSFGGIVGPSLVAEAWPNSSCEAQLSYLSHVSQLPQKALEEVQSYSSHTLNGVSKSEEAT